MKDIVAFDSETTGLHPGCRPVEFAAVRFDETGQVVDTFESLVNPECPIHHEAIEIHGILPEMVADAPTAGPVLEEFFEWLGDDRLLLAHKADFDVGVVSWNAMRCGVAIPDDLMVIDTCAIAKSLRETRNNKLDTLVDAYQIARRGRAHRALSDAGAAADYYNLVRGKAPTYSPGEWRSLCYYQYTEDFPEVLADLPDLVRDARPFTFRYEDKDGTMTERTLTPWGWALQAGEINVHGFCHLRQERRQFRADRIVARMAEVA